MTSEAELEGEQGLSRWTLVLGVAMVAGAAAGLAFGLWPSTGGSDDPFNGGVGGRWTWVVIMTVIGAFLAFAIACLPFALWTAAQRLHSERR